MSYRKTLVKEDGKEHLRECMRIEVFFFFLARQGQGKSQVGDEEEEHG